MASWKEKLSGYEFVLWNFDRFDSNSSVWVQEAFAAKKYASAADYIRLYAVKTCGGIYLDMDMEVVRAFDTKLLGKPLMLAYENNRTKLIEAGCFGAEKGHPYITKCLDYYTDRHFSVKDAENFVYILPKVMSESLRGFTGVEVYPSDYFTAKNPSDCRITVTANTCCVHHFAASWFPAPKRFYAKIRNKSIEIFGPSLGKAVIFPLFVITTVISDGLTVLIKRIKEHIGKTE
jgi:hypothetical protein